MPAGFFAESNLLESKGPVSLVPKCGSCGLYKTCKSPKMSPSGNGGKRILIVGEAPGGTEDKTGKHFVGETGTHLRDVLKSSGIKMRSDCWLTNSLICHMPPKEGELDKRLEWCKPNLIKTIKELKPEVIIPLGKAAVKSLISHIWKDDVGGIDRWVGWQIPSVDLNAWICPNYDPKEIIRRDNEVLDRYFENNFKKAAACNGRPWQGELPRYDDQVEVILDVDKAAKIIRKMIRYGGVVAFDYETNMLKPDSRESKILCCSVCWEGKKTIAYPWRGEAVIATRELILSDLWKIASNAKFEQRWTKAVFKHGVRRWFFDTMLGAHVLDNRPDITSIKFQSFIRLGSPCYDGHIKPLLKAKGYEQNKAAKEIEFPKLLLYNGIDSLYEYLVGKQQCLELGKEWPS